MGGERVVVTGAAGYVGSWVVRALLEHGYRVRATVRSLADDAKAGHVRSLGDVEVAQADLLEPNSFDAAVEGCEFVVHTASPILSKADDPFEAIVRPAVEGTHNVLEAARRAGTVKRVVQTSSAASVIDGALTDPAHEFTEADDNDSATVAVAPYDYSKREAERAARKFVDSLPAGEGFELTAINPTMVFGPVDAEHHLSTTPGIMRDLMSGSYPAAPNLTFGIVDVRDVALAHVRALRATTLSPRYLCYSESRSLIELARQVRGLYPNCRAPRLAMPNAVMYGAAMFDKRLTWSFLRRNLGRRRIIRNDRIRKELDITFRTADETVERTARDLVERGFVKLR